MIRLLALWLLAIPATSRNVSTTLKLKQAAHSAERLSLLELGSSTRSRSHGRLRARAMFSGPPRQEFFTTVSIGSPPQQFFVTLDTGSGNLMIPSRQCPDMACKGHRGFDRFLSTSAKDVVRMDEKEHQPINWPPRGDAEQLTLFFGSGKASGPVVNDKVCIGELTPGNHLCIRMNFMIAMSMSQEPFGLLPYDGILGLGLLELSATAEFNFLGQMAGKESLKKDQFALWLAHPEDGEDSEITIGTFKPERVASRIVWVQISNHPGQSTRSGYWQIRVGDIAVDNTALGFGARQACIDTGTSVIAGPSGMISALEGQLGIEEDCSNLKTLPLVGFVVEGVILNLEPTDYVLKAGGKCYSQFMGLDLPPPKGPIILLGDPFLRKYYTIFDRDSLKVGFALGTHKKVMSEQTNLLAWAKKMMTITE